ncbi:CBS domain-containing protein [Fulvivirgaceae bacterium BMA10]|uniref:CBS domain-containing protein n=1 Tax=Splendidivirga corallicola TaxID=3051826 RepID=A0ABT8KLF7_9BACT|nr:CBS domain-containing protein [Fulvivirgaceae bacterium BMA10]
MIAIEIINQMIPPLKTSDSAEMAMRWMEELRTNQLPVLDNGFYQGLISEEIILEENDLKKKVGDYPLVGKNCYVYFHQHIYEILKVASDNQVEIIAVLDEDNQFHGVINMEDTITAFAQTAAVQSPGGIIVLSLNQIDYSLAEISRLIEADNAKILSSCITNDVLDPSKIKLTLKLNITNLSHIIATLERFGYKIIARFHETKQTTSDKERLDILMRYLDI